MEEFQKNEGHLLKQNDKAFLRLQEDLKALGGTDDMSVLFTTAETAAASESGMSLEYFETHFEHLADWTDCPPQFVTIAHHY